MKYRSLAAMVVMTMLSGALFNSCNKDQRDFFRGSYGYSLSGTISCQDTLGNMSDFTITKEVGSIHIEPKGDAAVFTMDAVGGNVLVFDAVIDGEQISLSSAKRMLTVQPTDSSITPSKTIPVLMTGTGSKTNGLLIVNFTFSGDPFTVSYGEEGSIVAKEFSIIGSNVNCIANYRD